MLVVNYINKEKDCERGKETIEKMASSEIDFVTERLMDVGKQLELFSLKYHPKRNSEELSSHMKDFESQISQFISSVNMLTRQNTFLTLRLPFALALVSVASRNITNQQRNGEIKDTSSGVRLAQGITMVLNTVAAFEDARIIGPLGEDILWGLVQAQAADTLADLASLLKEVDLSTKLVDFALLSLASSSVNQESKPNRKAKLLLAAETLKKSATLLYPALETAVEDPKSDSAQAMKEYAITELVSSITTICNIIHGGDVDADQPPLSEETPSSSSPSSSDKTRTSFSTACEGLMTSLKQRTTGSLEDHIYPIIQQSELPESSKEEFQHALSSITDGNLEKKKLVIDVVSVHALFVCQKGVRACQTISQNIFSQGQGRASLAIARPSTMFSINTHDLKLFVDKIKEAIPILLRLSNIIVGEGGATGYSIMCQSYIAEVVQGLESLHQSTYSSAFVDASSNLHTSATAVTKALAASMEVERGLDCLSACIVSMIPRGSTVFTHVLLACKTSLSESSRHDMKDIMVMMNIIIPHISQYIHDTAAKLSLKSLSSQLSEKLATGHSLVEDYLQLIEQMKTVYDQQAEHLRTNIHASTTTPCSSSKTLQTESVRMLFAQLKKAFNDEFGRHAGRKLLQSSATSNSPYSALKQVVYAVTNRNSSCPERIGIALSSWAWYCAYLWETLEATRIEKENVPEVKILKSICTAISTCVEDFTWLLPTNESVVSIHSMTDTLEKDEHAYNEQAHICGLCGDLQQQTQRLRVFFLGALSYSQTTRRHMTKFAKVTIDLGHSLIACLRKAYPQLADDV